MRIKVLLGIAFLFMVPSSFAQKQVQKFKLSYRQETFVDGDFLTRIGPNLRIGKNLDVYSFGEFVRTAPFMEGAKNFWIAGAHVSYNVSQSGTYLRVLGKRNFTAETNYGYFLAMQTINKLPVQPTFLVDTNKLTCFGVYGEIYTNKWLHLGAWLNQAITNGCPTIVEFDIIVKF